MYIYEMTIELEETYTTLSATINREHHESQGTPGQRSKVEDGYIQ